MIGNEIHDFAKQLWPINRSITGKGVRTTLDLIKQHLPGLEEVVLQKGQISAEEQDVLGKTYLQLKFTYVD